jgi:hypothetical protein
MLPLRFSAVLWTVLLLAVQSLYGQTPGALAQPKAPDATRFDPTLGGSKTSPFDSVEWHDVSEWEIEGRAWPDAQRLKYYDRLPAEAENTVSKAVWNLSRDSAGMMTRFKTNATALFVDYKLTKPTLSMPIMPATGASGVDLYARDNAGKWRWVSVSKPATQEVKTELIGGLDPALREYAAYLPLYNGIEFLRIGVPKGSQFEHLTPRQKPVVFYGTSITHGASASRPGMVHTAILGRRLDMPVVNLGFSGNGRMDLAVGEFMTRIDAVAYVIDCLPNMQPATVTERCAPLVRLLRKARPETPIVLVEDRRFTNDWITPLKARFHTENHAALKSAFDLLIGEGLSRLFYIPGDTLYGSDGEGATDASHASDLGFMRQADFFEPVLRKALNP